MLIPPSLSALGKAYLAISASFIQFAGVFIMDMAGSFNYTYRVENAVFLFGFRGMS